MNKNNRHPNDGKKPITIFGPDFPFAFDDWIEHPAGLGSIPADKLGTEVAIVGAGRMRHQVVPVMGGLETHRVIPISLTFDHRAATGGEAARFLRALLDDLARAS